MNKEDFKECGSETGPSMKLVNVAKELNNQKLMKPFSQLLCVESSVANIKSGREELCEELLNE